MARKCLKLKNAKRKKISQAQYAQRQSLKKIIKDPNQAMNVRLKAQETLRNMKRDGSKVRYRNRCAMTGRPRGVYRDFQLSRNMIRWLLAFGKLPGAKQSSW